EARHGSYTKRIPSETFYFKAGIAFSTIGDSFSARLHMYPSIIDAAGGFVFSSARESLLCLMNSSLARFVFLSLNPTISFKNNDVERLCILPIAHADEVCRTITNAFRSHEHGREPSVEFRQPQPSSWQTAQRWAQQAVDAPANEPLPP